MTVHRRHRVRIGKGHYINYGDSGQETSTTRKVGNLVTVNKFLKGVITETKRNRDGSFSKTRIDNRSRDFLHGASRSAVNLGSSIAGFLGRAFTEIACGLLGIRR